MPAYPTLASAVTAWNLLPPGSAGIIVLPNFEAFAIDLTGPNAIQLPAQSQLLIASARSSSQGAPPEWNQSCVTLRGNIESLRRRHQAPTASPLPSGQLQFSGIWLSGRIRLTATPPAYS